MVANEHKHKHTEPFKCETCGAMVFTLAKMHAVVCGEYLKYPLLVDGSHKSYREYLETKVRRELEELEEKKKEKPKKERKKKVEKNNDLPVEEFGN